jgi:hypothetical protein
VAVLTIVWAFTRGVQAEQQHFGLQYDEGAAGHLGSAGSTSGELDSHWPSESSEPSEC